MQITFLGATNTVTGSKYLIEIKDKKYLIDCGLFQGDKELRLRNWDQFPINPKSIDAILLTHAHIDHSGYIPRLVNEGFKGEIYCTHATHDLCKILLMDSASLQEEDAKRANRYHFSKHKPALPLYTRKDAKQALQLFKSINFQESLNLNHHLKATFYPAGHILGASFVKLESKEKSIVFSGDLGRVNDPVMKAPAPPEETDYLVIESTYGDRLHPDTNPLEEIKDEIVTATSKGGSILIPSFAVGRAQSILYYIHQLKQAKAIPPLPVYVDSPMATSATELFCKYHKLLKLSKSESHQVCDMATYVKDDAESKRLDTLTSPAIIISASGMATGGRVLRHLKTFLLKENNTVLFTGFQARGTRGDRLQRGEKEIKIHGKMYPVHAKIAFLSNLSAHADYLELLNWISQLSTAPKKIYITHGEESSAAAFKEKIIEKFGWNAIVPEYLQKEPL